MVRTTAPTGCFGHECEEEGEVTEEEAAKAGSSAAAFFRALYKILDYPEQLRGQTWERVGPLLEKIAKRTGWQIDDFATKDRCQVLRRHI